MAETQLGETLAGASDSASIQPQSKAPEAEPLEAGEGEEAESVVAPSPAAAAGVVAAQESLAKKASADEVIKALSANILAKINPLSATSTLASDEVAKAAITDAIPAPVAAESTEEVDAEGSEQSRKIAEDELLRQEEIATVEALLVEVKSKEVAKERMKLAITELNKLYSSAITLAKHNTFPLEKIKSLFENFSIQGKEVIESIKEVEAVRLQSFSDKVDRLKSAKPHEVSTYAEALQADSDYLKTIPSTDDLAKFLSQIEEMTKSVADAGVNESSPTEYREAHAIIAECVRGSFGPFLNPDLQADEKESEDEYEVDVATASEGSPTPTSAASAASEVDYAPLTAEELEERSSQLESLITRHVIGDHEASVKKLSDQLERTNINLSTLQAKKSRIEGQIASDGSAVETLQGEVKSLKDNILTLTNAIQLRTSQAEEKRKLVEENRVISSNGMQALNHRSEVIISDIAKNKEEMDGKLKIQNSAVRRLWLRVTFRGKIVSNLQGDIANLQATAKRLQSESEEVKAQKAKFESNKARIAEIDKIMKSQDQEKTSEMREKKSTLIASLTGKEIELKEAVKRVDKLKRVTDEIAAVTLQSKDLTDAISTKRELADTIRVRPASRKSSSDASLAQEGVVDSLAKTASAREVMLSVVAASEEFIKGQLSRRDVREANGDRNTRESREETLKEKLSTAITGSLQIAQLISSGQVVAPKSLKREALGFVSMAIASSGVPGVAMAAKALDVLMARYQKSDSDKIAAFMSNLSEAQLKVVVDRIVGQIVDALGGGDITSPSESTLTGLNDLVLEKLSCAIAEDIAKGISSKAIGRAITEGTEAASVDSIKRTVEEAVNIGLNVAPKSKEEKRLQKSVGGRGVVQVTADGEGITMEGIRERRAIQWRGEDGNIITLVREGGNDINDFKYKAGKPSPSQIREIQENIAAGRGVRLNGYVPHITLERKFEIAFKKLAGVAENAHGIFGTTTEATKTPEQQQAVEKALTGAISCYAENCQFGKRVYKIASLRAKEAVKKYIAEENVGLKALGLQEIVIDSAFNNQIDYLAKIFSKVSKSTTTSTSIDFRGALGKMLGKVAPYLGDTVGGAVSLVTGSMSELPTLLRAQARAQADNLQNLSKFLVAESDNMQNPLRKKDSLLKNLTPPIIKPDGSVDIDRLRKDLITIAQLNADEVVVNPDRVLDLLKSVGIKLDNPPTKFFTDKLNHLKDLVGRLSANHMDYLAVGAESPDYELADNSSEQYAEKLKSLHDVLGIAESPTPPAVEDATQSRKRERVEQIIKLYKSTRDKLDMLHDNKDMIKFLTNEVNYFHAEFNTSTPPTILSAEQVTNIANKIREAADLLKIEESKDLKKLRKKGLKSKAKEAASATRAIATDSDAAISAGRTIGQALMTLVDRKRAERRGEYDLTTTATQAENIAQLRVFFAEQKALCPQNSVLNNMNLTVDDLVTNVLIRAQHHSKIFVERDDAAIKTILSDLFKSRESSLIGLKVTEMVGKASELAKEHYRLLKLRASSDVYVPANEGYIEAKNLTLERFDNSLSKLSEALLPLLPAGNSIDQLALKDAIIDFVKSSDGEERNFDLLKVRLEIVTGLTATAVNAIFEDATNSIFELVKASIRSCASHEGVGADNLARVDIAKSTLGREDDILTNAERKLRNAVNSAQITAKHPTTDLPLTSEEVINKLKALVHNPENAEALSNKASAIELLRGQGLIKDGKFGLFSRDHDRDRDIVHVVGNALKDFSQAYNRQVRISVPDPYAIPHDAAEASRALGLEMDAFRTKSGFSVSADRMLEMAELAKGATKRSPTTSESDIAKAINTAVEEYKKAKTMGIESNKELRTIMKEALKPAINCGIKHRMPVGDKQKKENSDREKVNPLFEKIAEIAMKERSSPSPSATRASATLRGMASGHGGGMTVV